MDVLKSLFNVLLPKQRKESFFQVFLMIISMLFELLSITLILPVIAIISDDDFLNKYQFAEDFIFFIDINSKNQLLLYFMFIFMLIYLIKSIVIAAIINHNYKFIFSLQSSFSSRLFSGYLNHPLTFHLKRNSAELIQNSILIVNNVTSSLVAIIQLLTEVVTAVSICILILFISPSSLLLSLLIFGPAIYFFLRFIKNKLSFWGKQFQFHDNNRIQLLQQGLSTLKEIKLTSKEIFFSLNYQDHTNMGAHYARKQQFFQAVPRLFIEILMITALTAVVIFLVLNNQNFNSILILLGVFAAAAFRLLPSINRITSSIQTLRYCSSFIKTLENELVDINNIKKLFKRIEKIELKDKILIKDLTFYYDDEKKPILQNLNFEIIKGSMVGIIGSTGQGKSTLVNIILGLLSPSSGHIFCDNININDNLKSWQKNIGYVPQTITLIDDTLKNNIAFGIPEDEIDQNFVLECIQKSELSEFLVNLEKGLDTIVGERGVRFSGGERQRIGIARALYTKPEIIVFDEATSSLDTHTEKEILESINSLKGSKTIIMITHRLSTLNYCDKVYKLENSNIFIED